MQHHLLSLPDDGNIFERLVSGVRFEQIAKGRQGAILVRFENDCAPFVRSTTQYQNASQSFRAPHIHLMNCIADVIGVGPQFNNGMIEVYTPLYRSMGFHTDQSQDLAEDSRICIFSCYQTPQNPNRLLHVMNKLTSVEHTIRLEHNSIVVFSTEFNANHVHKIVLDPEDTHGNTWLGLTLRTSKTMIAYTPEPHFLSSNSPLREATNQECKELYKLKSAENQKNGVFRYPEVDYTISPGDLIIPLLSETASETSEVNIEAHLNEDEAQLNLNHTLVLHREVHHSDLEFISKHFAGEVIRADRISSSRSGLIFLAGDISAITIEGAEGTATPAVTFIVEELSCNFDSQAANVVTLGELPINIHGLCVFFRRFFDDANNNIFPRLQEEHQFQNLTESDKPSTAFRTGLYITNVTASPNGETDFRLLRCSSNFTGPTEGLRPTDRDILRRVNSAAAQYFDRPADLNHVLAQIYHNSPQCKAKIKAHADKTKDMPSNGVMAFCTFYACDRWHPQVRPSTTDCYDRCYKGTSALTKLRFKLKKPEAPEYSQMPREFSVTLYPGSVLLLSLSTNRIYTHEICPSLLPHEYLPTRMGYVVRCSQTEAVHRDGATFVRGSKDRDDVHRLERPTERQLVELRRRYVVENATDARVDYGEVYFSLNNGDFMAPIP